MSDPEANRKPVLDAMTGAFISRDPAAVGRCFSDGDIRHNPAPPNGPAVPR